MPIQVIVYKLVFTTMCRMFVHSTLQRLFQSEPRYLCSFYLQQRKDFSVEKQKEEFDRATPHVLLVKEKYNYLHTTQKNLCHKAATRYHLQKEVLLICLTEKLFSFWLLLFSGLSSFAASRRKTNDVFAFKKATSSSSSSKPLRLHRIAATTTSIDTTLMLATMSPMYLIVFGLKLPWVVSTGNQV